MCLQATGFVASIHQGVIIKAAKRLISELGEAAQKRWEKFNPTQMGNEFSCRRPIRLLVTVSKGLEWQDYGVVRLFHLQTA